MRITLPSGKWRKRLKIKALPPFAELHKVRAGNYKIFKANNGAPEEGERAHCKLLEIQKRIPQYMIPITVSGNMTQEYEKVEALFEGLSFKECLMRIAQPCVDKRDAAKKRRDKVKQCAENPKIIANKRRKKLDVSKQPPVSKNSRTKDAKSVSYGRSKLAIHLPPK